MIKTDLQLLEDNRDGARSMVLALQAQIDLTQGKILGLIDPSQEADRANREKVLAGLKVEQKGHNMMVDKLDALIKELDKNGHLRTSDEQGIQS